MRRKIMRILTVIMILGVLVFNDCSVSYAKVYKEDHMYTLIGKVQKVRWQNWADKSWQTSYFLYLDKKINLKTTQGDKLKEKRIQMYGRTNSMNKKIRKYNGKKVKVRGVLASHGTAYYLTDIDLEVTKIYKYK